LQCLYLRCWPTSAACRWPRQVLAEQFVRATFKKSACECKRTCLCACTQTLEGMHAHASASVHTQAHTHTLLLDMHEPTRADTRKHMHICLHTFKNALRLCTEFALSPLLFLYATLLWLPCYGMKEPRACPWHTLLRSLSHSNRKAGTFIPILMQKLNRH